MENKSTPVVKQTEPKKKVSWEFNSNTATISVSANSVKADNERRFSFKIERYKDSQTHEESLKIVSLLDGEENGYIVTSILDLDNDIKQLKRFGVVLENTYYRDLYKMIELNYLDIPDTEVTFDKTDGRKMDLMEQVKLYVEGDKDLITPDFCYVPVNMFNELAFDCSYEMKSLRSALATGKDIHTTADRYAILTRINGKPERVIAFYRDKLGVELPTKRDSKENGKSGANEK